MMPGNNGTQPQGALSYGRAVHGALVFTAQLSEVV